MEADQTVGRGHVKPSFGFGKPILPDAGIGPGPWIGKMSAAYRLLTGFGRPILHHSRSA